MGLIWQIGANCANGVGGHREVVDGGDICVRLLFTDIDSRRSLHGGNPTVPTAGTRVGYMPVSSEVGVSCALGALFAAC